MKLINCHFSATYFYGLTVSIISHLCKHVSQICYEWGYVLLSLYDQADNLTVIYESIF
jgi:hypothetical protein